MPGDDLTHGPPATKKAGGSHHRFGRINRHSLRDGLRLISRSPRGPGFLAPVAGVMPACRTRQGRHRHHRQLDLSVGRPGPRDFAVRAGHVRLTWHSRPPHPRLTYRDDRPKRPSSSRRDAREDRFDLPDGASADPAADWHDGQLAYGTDAGVTCRRRHNAPSYRFITADHDPPYELNLTVEFPSRFHR